MIEAILGILVGLAILALPGLLACDWGEAREGD